MADFFASLRNRLFPSVSNHGRDRLARWLAQKTFNTSDRLSLYEDLAFLLDNRQQVQDALAGIVRTHKGKRPPVVLCVEDALAAMGSGRSLASGLGGWIPRQEATILSAGVKDLSGALKRASEVVKGLAEMKVSAWTALAYPLMLLTTTGALMQMVSAHFLPRLAQLIPEDKWTGWVWWLGAITHFFVDNALLLGGGMVGITSWIIWSLPHLTGTVRSRVLDRMLPWSLYREMQGVSFLLNFSALLRSQVQTQPALDMLCRHASPWLYERLSATSRQVGRGKQLGLALADSGYVFPSADAIDKLKLLTTGKGFEGHIENFARVWLTQSIRRIQRTTKWLQLAGMLLTAGYMGLTVLATQDLSNLIGIR
ncbi:type II secretion system F family protein [Rahnella sp. BCC 1045]|uniref:type II secretion system F family protein n=1 Tax=Rahnella sp. BCC 1045 TaxID=2816251 RepID=UPI001C2746E1|nr:type II secretion system F family protein [Rahnella sp. BCC 1045]MBU9819679.1 type II secretion system F family protein [Rahnella sp. BCC 1045]